MTIAHNSPVSLYLLNKDSTMAADKTPNDWLRLIQAEYREMPGMHLTKSQALRLWQLEPQLCDALLDALVIAEFLKKTPHEAYVLAREGR